MKSLVDDQDDIFSPLPCPACLGILQVYLAEGFLNRVSDQGAPPPNLQTLFVMSESEWMLLNECLWKNKAIRPEKIYTNIVNLQNI